MDKYKVEKDVDSLIATKVGKVQNVEILNISFVQVAENKYKCNPDFPDREVSRY